jgi:hypothetical protein
MERPAGLERKGAEVRDHVVRERGPCHIGSEAPKREAEQGGGDAAGKGVRAAIKWS